MQNSDRTSLELINSHEQNGYILDAESHGQDYIKKTTPDGQTALIPQPGEDPDGPLKWPQRKKDIMLIVICYTSLMSDYSSAAGIPAIIPQAKQWHVTPEVVQQGFAGHIFMLGAGGIIIVAWCSFLGVLPVTFGCQTVALGLGIWCVTAESYQSYTAARILDGFFATVGVSVT